MRTNEESTIAQVKELTKILNPLENKIIMEKNNT